MAGIKTKRVIGLVFFLSSFIINSLAQESRLVNHEKIYIHFDRPFYSAGETVWFKAYLFNKSLPSLLSDELYLQLEDGTGKVINKKKYPISGATVSGNIVLNDSLPRGYYTIKAITKAIASDDAVFMYTKNLFIYNTIDPYKNNPLKKALSLQFFPESGHLIDRIKTQVAFKATDETGNPVFVSGVIKSDSANIVVPFTAFHDGIGKVSFTPHLADMLFAEVEVNGNKYKFPLPAVEASGINLKIADADSGKNFEITRSRKDRELFDTVRLVVKMNNDTVFENTIAFNNEQVLTGLLKTKNITSGILHFILLNKNAVPLAERLSFVNNKEYLSQPDLVLIKRDSSKRGDNSFQLKFKDTITRSLSISVTEIATQEFPDKENICSRLLLTDDLRGYVYDPGYYFEVDDAAHNQALDNLMLTHGWTRYNWNRKNVTATATNTHYLLSISGTVNAQANEKPVSGGILAVQMTMEDSSYQAYDIVVDNNGRFKMDSLLFFGNAKIYYTYSVNGKSNLPVNLHFDKDAGDDFFAKLFAGMKENISAKDEDSFNIRAVSMPDEYFEGKYKRLSTIFLKSKSKRPEDKINEKYASPLFRTTGKIVLDNINKPCSDKSLNLVNYLLTNIHNLAYDSDLNSLVNKKNFSILTQKNWVVELFLDESVSSLDAAKGITMEKVAFIKFYEAGFIGVGTQAPGGAVSVYLKRYEDEPAPVDNTVKYLSYKGYSVTKEFYNPDYTVMPENKIPDNRLTLYWNPLVMDVDAQDMKFNFFNNDISKKLSIVVEGFDGRGRLVHYERSF
ncbi:MAG: MG2 domain-containing protein [Ferruginibacter sp.]